jgi:hypothetical protein
MRYFETKFFRRGRRIYFQTRPENSPEKSFTTLILQNKRMTQDFLRNFKTTFGNFGQNMQDSK